MITSWQLFDYHVNSCLLFSRVLELDNRFCFGIPFPCHGVFLERHFAFSHFYFLKQLIVSFSKMDPFDDSQVDRTGEVILCRKFVSLLDTLVASIVLTGQHVGDSVFHRGINLLALDAGILFSTIPTFRYGRINLADSDRSTKFLAMVDHFE